VWVCWGRGDVREVNICDRGVCNKGGVVLRGDFWEISEGKVMVGVW
jgi:hypothetical protein